MRGCRGPAAGLQPEFTIISVFQSFVNDTTDLIQTAPFLMFRHTICYSVACANIPHSEGFSALLYSETCDDPRPANGI